MSKLIIARHHESDWNKMGLWTGMRDRHLTEYGFSKSAEMGLLIKEIQIGKAFASMQVRSIETLSSMLDAMGQFHVKTVHSEMINERDYGDYTGKNKWDMEKLIGEEQWESVRRDWDCPVPNGETLKMVYKRAVTFYLDKIVPPVVAGENVLVVSHGNAIRAMMKYIERIPDEKVRDIEMLFGEVVIYEIDLGGHMITKEIRKVKSTVNA
jgi:2,3-bisphosphoglycerate-dependent phosphoglycerate mutase